MSKKKQLLFCCAIVFVLLVSIPTVAFAECYGAFNEIPSFPQVYLWSSNTNTVKVVQSFLRTYNSGWADTIDSAGGVDGSFGPTTYQLICSFQTYRGLTADGIVGSNTWTEISNFVFEYTTVYPEEGNLTHQGNFLSNTSCYLAFQTVWKYRHLPAEGQINFYHNGGVLFQNLFHNCSASGNDFNSGNY